MHISICLVAMMLIFYAYFNRVPQMAPIECHSEDILSPAYGTVLEVNQLDSGLEIIIFLSIFDVHQQYYPVSGTIEDTQYDATGRFEVAQVANKSRMNEKQITTISMPCGLKVVVKQIAGLLARSIEFDGQIGDCITRGQRMGCIRLGSRVDLILPLGSKSYVQKGDTVNGPQTIIARLGLAAS